MRYAQIVPFEVCNGKGAGVSLFTQGCRFQCKNCFNKETWNFNGGKEWTEEIENKFFALADRPYIKRISILGGEPLANENVSDVFSLIKRLKIKFPNKVIWVYTGYKFEDILNNPLRKQIIEMCDVVVDGRYIDELRDLTLKFAGSKNQRVINAQKSLQNQQVVLWE